jgi:hypothetical protein
VKPVAQDAAHGDDAEVDRAGSRNRGAQRGDHTVGLPGFADQ